MDLFSRILEHFILNGPDPKALDKVLGQLSDKNRKQPQDLDKAVIGMWGLQHCSVHYSHVTESCSSFSFFLISY